MSPTDRHVAHGRFATSLPAAIGPILVTGLLTIAGCSGGGGAGTVDITAAKQAAESKGLTRSGDPAKASRVKKRLGVPGQPVVKRSTR
jgi:hypothetical protein